MKCYLCSFLGFLEVFRKKSPQIQSSKLLEGRRRSDLPEDTYRQFSLSEIKVATNNFHPDMKIGKGRLGTVYQCTIDDGIMVAFKHCQTSRSFGGVDDLQNEVVKLCQLRHPHLVSLIGFCEEQNYMILVYEYTSRGSLYCNLFGKTYDPLFWKQRLKICIGIARGLHYLHTGAKRAVIYRDIECSKILFDDEGSSKITDFSLSRMGPRCLSKPLLRMESRIIGTYGHMALEYTMHGELTEKVDVFSFGVVLFEVLCGRKCSDAQYGLLASAAKYIREGTIYHLVDSYLKGAIAPDCFKQYLEIACSCVHNNRNERPDMGEVEVTLKLALELQEKADFEMYGINSHSECIYKDSSFCLPFAYKSSAEHDSNSETEFPSKQDCNSEMKVTH